MIEFYHFMIKELSEEYEGQFTSLGGGGGGGKQTFSVPIERRFHKS